MPRLKVAFDPVHDGVLALRQITKNVDVKGHSMTSVFLIKSRGQECVVLLHCSSVQSLACMHLLLFLDPQRYFNENEEVNI